MNESRHPAMRGLIGQAELHTRLWTNCMADVDQAAAWTSLSPQGNTFGFIALHLVDARYYLARYLGASCDSPFTERYKDARASSDIAEGDRPELEELRASWGEASGILVRRMTELEIEDLERESATRFPLSGTVVDGLAFLLHHEAYHIGQMGLARRILGLSAMAYD